ncbi:hypothetical protein FRAHR75_390063 [Frankia sp. Hr75.2]|nr:hypothetical protein FRAHR75_390063 [Frankia sp. Hr75.2]
MIPMDDDRYHDDTGEVRSWWRTPTSDDEYYDPWSHMPSAGAQPIPSLGQGDEQLLAAPEPRENPVRTALAVVVIGLGLAIIVLLLRHWVDGDDSQSGRSVAQNLGAASLFLAAPLPTTLSNLDKTLVMVASHDQS